MKMFLQPLSDSEILALYHPRQPPDDPEGVVNPQDGAKDREVPEEECNPDPTINATKFLAGHSPKDAEDVTSGREDATNKVEKSIDASDDKIVLGTEIKDFPIEPLHVNKTEDSEETHQYKEDLTKQTANEVLDKDIVPPVQKESTTFDDPVSDCSMVEMVHNQSAATEDLVSKKKSSED